jgi:hypothetical protein
VTIASGVNVFMELRGFVGISIIVSVIACDANAGVGGHSPYNLDRRRESREWLTALWFGFLASSQPASLQYRISYHEPLTPF